jgi:hypothetical protein
MYVPTVMVTLLDPGGTPRAWATADDLTTALFEAQRQLKAYKAKKRLLDDPLGWAEYSTKVEALP